MKLSRSSVLAYAACVMVLTSSACDRRPPQSVVEAADPANASDRVSKDGQSGAAQKETSKLRVDSASIVGFNPLRRENGTWTKQGCTLTFPENKDLIEVTSSSLHLFEGFFLSYESSDPGAFEFVLLGKPYSYAIPVRTNVDRTDVAEYFKKESALHTGYRFETSLDGVEPGIYMVDLFYQKDGVDYFCETGKKMNVKAL